MSRLTPIRQHARNAVKRRGQLIIPKWGFLSLGPELVINGDGLVNTNNWIPRNAILSVISGALDIADGGQFSVAYQEVPTVIGKKYLWTFNTRVGSSASQVGYGWGTQIPGDSEYANHEERDVSPTYPKSYYTVFIATSATTFLSLGPNTPEHLTAGELSCKEIIAGYAPVLGPINPPSTEPPPISNDIYVNPDFAGGAMSGPGDGDNPPTSHTIGFNTADSAPVDNLDGTFDWEINAVEGSLRSYLVYSLATNNPGLSIGDEIVFSWLIENKSAINAPSFSANNPVGVTVDLDNTTVPPFATERVGCTITITDDITYGVDFRIGLGVTSARINHLIVSRPTASLNQT